MPSDSKFLRNVGTLSVSNLGSKFRGAAEPKVPLAQRDDTLDSATIVMYTQTYKVGSEPKVSSG